MRDVLRTVAGSDSRSSTSGAKYQTSHPPLATMRVLHQLVLTCWSTLASEHQPNGSHLDVETATHVLSALAKPLNHLAATFSTMEKHQSSLAFEILCHACQALGTIGDKVAQAFGSTLLVGMLPISRIANLATASLAPMLSSLLNATSRQEYDSSNNLVLQQLGMKTLHSVVAASALAILHIPELLTVSVIEATEHYDVRAAMRAPGGEDHVGCLALMRLAFESHLLARAMIEAYPTILLQLCELHENLKQLEQQRQRGMLHGKGVTPKSRRILLKTISYLDAVISKERQCQSAMHNLFQQSIAFIVEIGRESAYSSADGMRRLCEVTFDLAEFSSTEVFKLFYSASDDAQSTEAMCVKTLQSAVLVGYSMLSTTTPHSEFHVEVRHCSLGALHVEIAVCSSLRCLSSGVDSELLYSYLLKIRQ